MREAFALGIRSGCDPEQLDPAPHGAPQHTGIASTAALSSSANTAVAQMTEIRAIKKSFDSNMSLVLAATRATALRCELMLHDGVPPPYMYSHLSHADEGGFDPSRVPPLSVRVVTTEAVAATIRAAFNPGVVLA